MRGISRVVSTRAKGWFVRIYRGGKTYAKFFSDGKYGGMRRALKLARRHLRAMEREHPQSPPEQRPPFRITPLPNNKTGVNGVCLTYQRDRDGRKLPCYSVHYRLGGRTYNKRFYLHWYDTKRQAFKEAVRFRREMESLMLREWKRKHRRQRNRARK